MTNPTSEGNPSLDNIQLRHIMDVIRPGGASRSSEGRRLAVKLGEHILDV